jgi:hypothetical protein
VALAAVVLGIIFIPRLIAPSTIQGTWEGSGTVSAQNSSTSQTVSISFGVYLNLTQSASGQLGGSGQVCVNYSGTVDKSSFTVSGSGSGSQYTMTWTYSGGSSPDTLQATLSGSSLTLSDNHLSGSTAATLSATAHSGSQSDFQNLCNTLPTPTT